MSKTHKKYFFNIMKLDKFCPHFKITAFTLAEVLIVLSIIGVVVAMTIPIIMEKAQEKSLVSGLLKFDTQLHQAISLWKDDIDCYDSAGECLTPQNLSDLNINNFNQIAKFMKILSKCQSTQCTIADWLPENTLDYYGNNESAEYGKVAKTGSGDGAFLLTDGTTFSLDVDSAGFDVTVDVNGAKKPNRIGKDTFKMRIGSHCKTDICYDSSYCNYYGTFDNGLGLCGVYSGTCNPNNVDPTKDNGAMPTSYVLINHKLPDFKALSQTISGFKT